MLALLEKSVTGVYDNCPLRRALTSGKIKIPEEKYLPGSTIKASFVRFQVLTAASMMMMMMMMMEAVRTSETSVDNHFTWQYNPENSSEHQSIFCFPWR
jgi:hypothetical protein